MTRRLLGVIALVLTASALAAAPAAAQWRPVVSSCHSFAALPGCTTLTNFQGAWNVAVSPDGKTAYATAWFSGAIRVFDRNPATGALTVKAGEAGCVKEGPTVAGVCAGGRGITRPDEILISADGKNVYVTSWADPVAAAIAVFNRDSAGVLTQKGGQAGCINDDGTDGCFDGRTVGGQGAVLSPDQNSIYVEGQSTLAVFKRSPADGTLEQLGAMDGCFGTSAVQTDGCTPTVFNPCCRQMAISGDGKNVYAPQAMGGVLIFNRNPATGAIALKPGDQGCVGRTGNGMCKAVPQFGVDTEALTLSADNRFVYVSHEGGIVTLARNSDGTLTFRSCLNDGGTGGCAGSSNITDLSYLAASPDGEDLLVANSSPPGGLTAFARNASTGALVRRAGQDGCISADGRGKDNGTLLANACRADARIGQHGHIHFAGNNQIYAGFFTGDRIAVLKRDFYPVCQSRSVTARRGAATAIPLTCSDRNGDAVTRAIAQAPTAGTLGGINQAAASVFYNPFPKFSGPDHFSFRGIAAGLQGPPATISLTVPAGPKPKPKRIRGVTLAYTFAAFSDHTVLTKLAVKGVPRRSTVRVTCTCGRKFTKKRAHGTVSIKKLVNVRLPVGSRITVTVTKPRTIGAAKLLRIRSRAAPEISSRCLKPGSRKLRRRC
jgi:DNA-binding beta-propeller fold protein YncE